MRTLFARIFFRLSQGGLSWFLGGPSAVRKETNGWLKLHAAEIRGNVLSVGSGTDEDGEGRKYRNYFKGCSSYKTSDMDKEFRCDLTLDIRAMPQIPEGSYECVFCAGVLEHVDDFQSAFKEITRVLKHDGILLLGVPFRQAIHAAPYDYWRFTEEGVRYMLRENYEILEFKSMDDVIPSFPSAYWIKAKKR